jgi:hypothetical protein
LWGGKEMLKLQLNDVFKVGQVYKIVTGVREVGDSHIYESIPLAEYVLFYFRSNANLIDAQNEYKRLVGECKFEMHECQ